MCFTLQKPCCDKLICLIFTQMAASYPCCVPFSPFALAHDSPEKALSSSVNHLFRLHILKCEKWHFVIFLLHIVFLLLLPKNRLLARNTFLKILPICEYNLIYRTYYIYPQLHIGKIYIPPWILMLYKQCKSVSQKKAINLIYSLLYQNSFP